jgi:hypothetical protein
MRPKIPQRRRNPNHHHHQTLTNTTFPKPSRIKSQTSHANLDGIKSKPKHFLLGPPSHLFSSVLEKDEKKRCNGLSAAREVLLRNELQFGATCNCGRMERVALAAASPGGIEVQQSVRRSSQLRKQQTATGDLRNMNTDTESRSLSGGALPKRPKAGSPFTRPCSAHGKWAFRCVGMPPLFFI